MPDGSGFRGPQWEEEPKRTPMRIVRLSTGPYVRPWWARAIDYLVSKLISSEPLFRTVPNPSGGRAPKGRFRFKLNWRHPMAVPLCLLVLLLSPLLLTWAVVGFVGASISDAMQRLRALMQRWRAFLKGASHG